MRIAIKPQPHGGAVTWFRGTAPGHYLSERHSVPILHSDAYSHELQRRFVRESDVVHLISPAGRYEEAPAEFKERRGVLSVDLDDDIWTWLGDQAREAAERAQMTVAASGKAVSAETIKELESWLRAADVVTTTTAYLAHVIRERTGQENVRVVPNAISPECQKVKKRPEKVSQVLRKLRGPPPPARRVVGWTGSVAHVPDLTPLLSALARIRSVDGAFTVRSLGPVDFMQSEGFRRQFTGTVDYTPTVWRDPVTLKAGLQVPFENYYDALEAMSPDVAAIPMRESPFNLGKSAVTLYSWAAQGVPCVVSETGPYAEAKAQGFPARYVPHEDRDAWARELRALIYEPSDARELGAKAHAWVMERHAFPRAAEAWEAVWREACERKGVVMHEREVVTP